MVWAAHRGSLRSSLIFDSPTPARGIVDDEPDHENGLNLHRALCGCLKRVDLEEVPGDLDMSNGGTLSCHSPSTSRLVGRT